MHDTKHLNLPRHQSVMFVELDIVIPVYNEGANIEKTLDMLAMHVTKTWVRVLIVYDRDDDDTLPVIRQHLHLKRTNGGDYGYWKDTVLHVAMVRNKGQGAHSAVMTGFRDRVSPYVMMYPADDHSNNAAQIDVMVEMMNAGCDIVCASRLMRGGKMVGYPLLKAVIMRAANWTLRHVARLPTDDATSGFRMFSRRLVERVPLESDQGFCYSIELLVKAHRLGLKIGQVPVVWFERSKGVSRFKVLKWLPAYLRWYRYAFATTFLRRKDVHTYGRIW